jgi:peptidoglycan/LPS O-acetylase OafA/YrhL
MLRNTRSRFRRSSALSTVQTADKVIFGKDHLVVLDSLRGVAALSVVLYHVGWNNPLYSLGYVRNSYLMVDVFFVLSGFVISLNYNRRIVDLNSAARFMWLRFWRLYPLHFILVLAFLMIEIAKWIANIGFGVKVNTPAFATNDGWALLSNLLLVQALHLHDGLTFNVPAWSISVEFYAYSVFALLLLITRKLVLAALIVSTASAVTLVAISSRGLDYTYDLGFIRCLFSFFLGVLAHGAYSALHRNLDRPGGRITGKVRQIAATVAVFMVFAVITLLSLKPSPAYDFALPLLAAILITALAIGPTFGVSAFFRLRPIVWLGTVSYSIYMVQTLVNNGVTFIMRHVLHVPTGSLFRDVHQPLLITHALGGAVLVVLFVTAVLSVSHFTFRYIELPFRDWSKKTLSDT